MQQQRRSQSAPASSPTLEASTPSLDSNSHELENLESQAQNILDMPPIQDGDDPQAAQRALNDIRTERALIEPLLEEMQALLLETEAGPDYDHLQTYIPRLQSHLNKLDHHEQEITASLSGTKEQGDTASTSSGNAIIDSAEKIDQGGNITYKSNFQGVDNPQITDPSHSPANDPDQNLRGELEKGWALNQENCCIFITHVLTDAGYDLDCTVNVNGQDVTVRRLILIHSQTLLKGNKTPLDQVAQDKDNPYYEVLKGVVTALTKSGQGSEIHTVNDLRPGDLLQWWCAAGNGHTTIIHEVKGETTLDKSSKPSDVPSPFHVTGVAVMGAQSAITPLSEDKKDDDYQNSAPDTYGKQDNIYVTEFISLHDNGKGEIPSFADKDTGKIVAWWAVRPNGSPWAQPPAPTLR